MITTWKHCCVAVVATLAFACTTHAATAETSAPARGPLKNGPLLQGLSLNGPLIQGLSLNGPLIQGLSLNGPVIQGLGLNGPLIQGLSMNGPLLQGTRLNGWASEQASANSAAPQRNDYYGQGVGVFAMPAGVGLHSVPGHSPFSGIASSDVRVTLIH